VVGLAKGKTVDEAAAITPADVERELDGYPEKKKDYPERALEALHVAIDDYRGKVASGSLPDYASVPRAASAQSPAPAEAAAPPTNGASDSKLLINLR
jgi:hypothetical protein